MEHIAAVAPRQPRINKPSIVEILSRYTDLHRQGREEIGLCPFHTENTPSFKVNEEKGVFHCFGCGAGGDVITFIQKIEDLDFKEALAHLGLTERSRPARSEIRKKKELKRQAEIIATWALNTSDKIAVKMRRLGLRASMAHKVLQDESSDGNFLCEELDRCEREWNTMETLQQDLIDRALVLDLWQQQEAILNILGDVGTDTVQSPQNLPLLTQEYRGQLQAIVRGEV